MKQAQITKGQGLSARLSCSRPGRWVGRSPGALQAARPRLGAFGLAGARPRETPDSSRNGRTDGPRWSPLRGRQRALRCSRCAT
eukprot:9230723-Alexandrium_andersonii.AAC.1